MELLKADLIRIGSEGSVAGHAVNALVAVLTHDTEYTMQLPPVSSYTWHCEPWNGPPLANCVNRVGEMVFAVTIMLIPEVDGASGGYVTA